MSQTDPDEPELLTVAEVAQWLRVDVRTIYRWVRVAQIPHIRLGHGLRFIRTDVDAWMHRRAEGTGTSHHTKE